MPQSVYDRLPSSDGLITTVGDGSPDPRGKTGQEFEDAKVHVNGLSGGNIDRAGMLLLENRHHVLLIVGGNDGEHGLRGDKTPGSLMEAERMSRRLLAKYPELAERIITDCDPEFQERYGLRRSGNTPQNGRNIAAVYQEMIGAEKEYRDVDIVAEMNHLGRVIGATRLAMMLLEVLPPPERMTGHPVISSFAADTSQDHIKDLETFVAREWKVKIHHLLPFIHHGSTNSWGPAVPFREFILAWKAASQRRKDGTEVKVTDDNGKVYMPDLPYGELCVEPFDARNRDAVA